MMYKNANLLVMVFILICASSLYAVSSSSVYFVPGGCLRCWEYSLDMKFSGDAIAPHFVMKFNWFEFYFGADFSATSENLTADAQKFKTIDTFTYLAEVDSYSLDLSVYFIEPENKPVHISMSVLSGRFLSCIPNIARVLRISIPLVR